MTATTLPRSRPMGEPGMAARVWPSLARREAGFALRHPLLWVGVVASLYVLWSFNRSEVPHLGGYSTFVGLGLAPLSGAALLVAHLQASRAPRHGTLEIEEPAPARQRARTLGHLVGSLAVVPVAAVIVTAYVAYLYWLGGTGQPEIGELLVGPLVVGVAAVAGVAAGTWFPNRFGGLIGLGLLAGVQIALHDALGTMHWFAWWHTVLWHPNPDLWIRPTGAHLVYLLGAAAAVAAVALLRHGLRPLPVSALVLGAGMVIAAGVVQVQPPTDAEVDRIWNRVAEPAVFWETEERNGVAYRIHASYERWIDDWDSVIQRTLAPIPQEERPAFVVEQRHHPFLSQLAEEVGYGSPEEVAIINRGYDLELQLLDDRRVDPWPIEVGDTFYRGALDPLVQAVAVRAVGLPLIPFEVEGRPYTDQEIADFNTAPEILEAEDVIDAETGPWWPGKERGDPPPQSGDRWQLSVACNAEGQAREVVAAWLSAQASPEIADAYRQIRRNGVNGANDSGHSEVIWELEPGVTGVNWWALGWLRGNPYGAIPSGGAVSGSPTATDLAAQLLDLPQSQVGDMIARHWDEWTDPATPVQAIIDSFDLEPPPTPEQWVERSGEDPSEYADAIAAYPHDLDDDLLGDQEYPPCP